jgi:hypothetical protein
VHKAYHIIRKWDHWLTGKIGRSVVAAEARALEEILPALTGDHIVLIGTPNQQCMMASCTIIHKVLCSSMPVTKINFDHPYIEVDLARLPFLSGSLDAVILPHTLELLDNPRQLFAEACRVIKPSGHIVIINFNPFSLWGLRHILKERSTFLPCQKTLIPAFHIKKWLGLADFKLLKSFTFLFHLPMRHSELFKKFRFLDRMSKLLFPFGGVYIILATAKVVPLSPIKLSWKQSLTGVFAPLNIPESTMRNNP